MDPDGGRLPVVDWSAACRKIPGGAEGARTLAAMMVDECPRLLGEVRQALADGDATRARLSAHTLRGAAQHFAAEEAVATATEMEALADAGDLDAARDALPHLETVVQRLATALGDADRLNP
ncbi:MAG: Hpt domain-containing protein [Planctomycetota bacterium]|jgi:HPt (histidine-containing phosphotransfer) domain-containing protein